MRLRVTQRLGASVNPTKALFALRACPPACAALHKPVCPAITGVCQSSKFLKYLRLLFDLEIGAAVKSLATVKKSLATTKKSLATTKKSLATIYS